jgi:hypothetical protein
MKSTGAIFLVLLCASLVSCDESFQASLNGASDNANTETTGTFETTCTIDKCDYSLNVTSIDDLIQAHLHLGNSSVASGPVVVFLLQPISPPLKIQGTGIIAGSFNATDFVNNYTGLPFSTIITNMGTSNIYVNMHTKEYPNGLIRGQTSTDNGSSGSGGTPGAAPGASG